jgi:uncharacterized membrane protein required for colicin V production
MLIHGFNWVDVLFVILLLGTIYKGVRIGVGGQLLSLAGCFLILFAALNYYNFVSRIIFGFLLYKWARPVSFFSIVVLIFAAVTLWEKAFSVADREELAPIERIGGAVIAALRAFIIFGIVSMFFLLLPFSFTRVTIAHKSRLGMFFVELDAKIYSAMTGHLGLSKKRPKEEIIGEFIPDYETEKG